MEKQANKRILCVGDYHLHETMIDELEDILKFAKPTHIVFLGDYMDDWGALPYYTERAIAKLIEFYRKHKKICTFLYGNHDISNIYGGKYACAGYNFQNFYAAQKLANRIPLKRAHAIDNILFTHAGVTNAWAKGRIKGKKARTIAKELNELPLSEFACVGAGRGGHEAPSPIWADKDELVNDQYGDCVQVVGHTPVKSICWTRVARKKPQLFFCDTYSTYSNGMPIGDQTVMVLNTDDLSNPTILCLR